MAIRARVDRPKRLELPFDPCRGSRAPCSVRLRALCRARSERAELQPRRKARRQHFRQFAVRVLGRRGWEPRPSEALNSIFQQAAKLKPRAMTVGLARGGPC